MMRENKIYEDIKRESERKDLRKFEEYQKDMTGRGISNYEKETKSI